VPRYFCIEDWSDKTIVDLHDSHPQDGNRRLTFMMLDQNVAA
jgi:hypothetical protein